MDLAHILVEVVFWIGCTVACAGGLGLTALAVWAAAEGAFKALKSIFTFAWILAAMREYAKTHPAPKWLR